MSAKNDKLHLIENSDILDKNLPNRKNRSLESIHLKTIKKDDKVKKKISPPKITTDGELKKDQPYASLMVSTSSIHVGDPVTAAVSMLILAEDREENKTNVAVVNK